MSSELQFYGTVEDIRKLSGVGKSLQDFSDEDIEKYMAAGKDIIDAKTGNEAWSSEDPAFDLVIQIEGSFAAAFALMRGGGTAKSESEKYWNLAMQMLDILISTDVSDLSDSDVKIAVSQYDSYPLGLQDNPDLEPYRSTKRMRLM